MATRDPLLRRQANAKYYEKVIAAGKCWSCGAVKPPEDAYRNCAACRERQRLKARDYYQRKKAAREALIALTVDPATRPDTAGVEVMVEAELARRAEARRLPTPEGACWVCKQVTPRPVLTAEGRICAEDFLAWEDVLRAAAGLQGAAGLTETAETTPTPVSP